MKIERYFDNKFNVNEILDSVYTDKLDTILDDMLSNSNINF